MPDRPREAVELARLLRLTAKLSTAMAHETTDLWWLGHERPTKGEQTRRPQPGYREPKGGNPKAKEAFKQVDAKAKDLAQALADAQRLLSAGPSPEPLKGTLLGDEAGEGARAEFGRLRAAQRRRRERGDFTPYRNWPQTQPGGKA